MNHIYRLIWNRRLGAVQAVSELARSCVGGQSAKKEPRSPDSKLLPNFAPRRLMQAVMLAFIVTPAFATQNLYDVTNENDSGAGSLRAAVAAASANATITVSPSVSTINLSTSLTNDKNLTFVLEAPLTIHGSANIGLTNTQTGEITGGAGSQGVTGTVGAYGTYGSNGSFGYGAANGGAGGNGSTGGAGGTGGNGSVGTTGLSSTSALISNAGYVTGGAGGVGGTGGQGGRGGNGGSGGEGGVGGIGGVGVYANGSSILNTGHIMGGAGGIGGSGGYGGYGGNHGYGGASDYGYAGSNGSSGNSGNTGNGGAGGTGGVGLQAVNGAVITNSGSITGGIGGANGSGTESGARGKGGAGVSGDHFQLTNTGTITGGRYGSGNGTKYSGVGVLGNGNTTITNAGTISGGQTGPFSSYANAIEFHNGGNTLILADGYAFNGNVVSDNAGTGDTLALGGTTSPSGSFNISSIGDSSQTSRQYQGFRNYEKTGTSTWTITGTDDTTTHQNWTVSQGTLISDGASILGNLTNNATFALVDETVTNIGGDFVQSASHTLRTNVSSTSVYGKLNVTGTATLAGVLNVNVASPNGLAVNDSLTSVIHADGGVSGTFSSVTDNSSLFDFTAVYGTNDVDLTVAAASQTGILNATNGTGNSGFNGAASVLDQIINQAPSGQIANAFAPFSNDQQIAEAAKSTTPITSTPFVVANELTQNAADVTSNRLGASSGDLFTADQHLWIKPFASWTKQNDRDGVSGYKATTGGFVVGVDGMINDATRLGGAFAYGKVAVDGNRSSTGYNEYDVESYQLIGYGSHLLANDTKVTFQGSVGVNRSSADRHLTFAGVTANSSFNSLSSHLGAAIERTYTLSELTSITPSLTADYTWIRQNAYKESGAGSFNLNVNSTRSEQFLLGAKAKLVHQIDSATSLSVDMGVEYDPKANQSSITSAYAASPDASFITNGLKPTQWTATTGIGLTHKTASGMEVIGRYDARFRKGFSNQSASVTFRWQY